MQGLCEWQIISAYLLEPLFPIPLFLQIPKQGCLATGLWHFLRVEENTCYEPKPQKTQQKRNSLDFKYSDPVILTRPEKKINGADWRGRFMASKTRPGFISRTK